MSKGLVRQLGWLVVAVSVASMLHSIIYLINKKTNDVDASGWFLSGKVEGVRMLHWVKGVGDIFKWVIIYYGFAKLAALFSRKLFYIMCLKCFQSWVFTFTFIYNYSQSQWMNIISGAGVIGVIVLIFLPVKEKKQALLINIE